MKNNNKNPNTKLLIGIMAGVFIACFIFMAVDLIENEYIKQKEIAFNNGRIECQNMILQNAIQCKATTAIIENKTLNLIPIECLKIDE